MERIKFYQTRIFIALASFVFGVVFSVFLFRDHYTGVIKGQDESFVFCDKAYCETDGKTLRDGFYVSAQKDSEIPQVTISFYKAGQLIGSMANYLDSGVIAAIIPSVDQDVSRIYSMTVGASEEDGFKSVYIYDCITKDKDGECKRSFTKI